MTTTTDVHGAIADAVAETARELATGRLADGSQVSLIATGLDQAGEWLTNDGITAHPDDVTITE